MTIEIRDFDLHKNTILINIISSFTGEIRQFQPYRYKNIKTLSKKISVLSKGMHVGDADLFEICNTTLDFTIAFYDMKKFIAFLRTI